MRDAYGLPLQRGRHAPLRREAKPQQSMTPEARKERAAHAYVHQVRSMMKRRLVLHPGDLYTAFYEGMKAEQVAFINDHFAAESEGLMAYNGIMSGGIDGMIAYYEKTVELLQRAALPDATWDPGKINGVDD